MGFPFTAAQWKELERQAMIYKYMVASLPVPHDLLYTSSPLPASYLFGMYGNGLSLNWSGNGGKDAEPGRCKRTDGKKWRCSRDVEPNHKYCDRHLHRGRPRSRKPVEGLQTTPNKKTRFDTLNPQPLGSSKVSTFDHPLGLSTNPFDDSRTMVWNEEQQWQQLVEANMNSLGYNHQFEGNLNSESDFGSKSEMGLFERSLIDAWSIGLDTSKENDGNSKSSKGTHGNGLDDDMFQIHMGLGVIDSWVASHSSPGGPLAEVLRPGPQPTVVSNFAPRSDSSGDTTPICHNSNANSDMPFHWLN